MKLYIKIDYKDRYEISGTIKNKTRKVEEEIFLFYKATRIDFVLFRLDIYASSKGEHLIYTLDECFDCSMTAKDICFFVENRIENIWGQLKPNKWLNKWQKLKEWLKNQITDLRHIEIKTKTQSLRVNDAVNCFRQVLEKMQELEGEDE